MYIKPKKSLGQNFLVDKNIQRKIIAYYRFCCSPVVLEIGAGKGDLTALLANAASKVYAVEIDKALCGVLKERFKGLPQVKVVNRDILKVDLRDFLPAAKDKITVIGNIPYYITTPIIEHLFKQKENIGDIYLTVQKEFSTRITASAGSKDYGAFSCFIQYHTCPKELFSIKRTSFFPAPKVASAFLHLAVRQEPAVKVAQEKIFFKLIRMAFQQRRKTLRNSLKRIVKREKLEEFFRQYALDPNSRPESLSLEDFASLADFLKNKKKY